MAKSSEPNIYVCPFTVIIDTREQASFPFRGLTADAKDGGGPIVIPVKRAALKTGDYSIEGLEDRLSVERKSLEDLFGCVGSDRDRFVRQLERLNELEYGAMMIEADWARVLQGAPNSKLNPKAVVRSVIAWQMNYFPKIHWWFAPGRNAAERFTFRLLDRFWKTKGPGATPDRTPDTTV